MSRPLVGLTGRRSTMAGVTVPRTFHGLDTDLFLSVYADRVREAGALPVLLPQDDGAGARDLVDRLDGLVLVGGADVAPARYDPAATAEPGEAAAGPVPAQDAHELALLAAADAARLPLLAVCRGLQLLNVHRGGTLVRDLATAGYPGHDVYGDSPTDLAHRVAVAPGSRLHGVLGPVADTNSYHHQAVARLGAGLTVTARSDDGVVEAVEDPVAPLLGVQWHPEWLPGHRPLFDWLVTEAAAHRDARSQPSRRDDGVLTSAAVVR